MLERCVEGHDRVLGTHHPDTVRNALSLAKLLGRYSTANYSHSPFILFQ